MTIDKVNTAKTNSAQTNQIQTEYEVVASKQRFFIDPNFHQFVTEEILPHTPLHGDDFWLGFASILEEFIPRNQSLLAERDLMQTRIDSWHRENPFDAQAYRTFLTEIGYLQAEPGNVVISPSNVDKEIANVAGPQLVVPIKNARFAINAANARWGSLYDALYGTDAIPLQGELKPGKQYNPARGSTVISFARDFLDKHFPLLAGTHHDAVAYALDSGQLVVRLSDDSATELQHAEKFVGYTGDQAKLDSVLLINHGLHVVIQINHDGKVGAADAAGIDDILLEAAMSTIMDCEDSVAAVDAEDKIEVYRNWLGLTRGDLKALFDKGGRSVSRSLEEDKVFMHKDGSEYKVHGRSLMLIRNVGHLMNIDLVKDASGNEVPEGIVDAVITSLIASIDIRNPAEKCNSRTGSIYIVKPKMHGPAEVTFTSDLFASVEDLLNLKRNTIKIGIMDEERRTTVNLKSCIQAAKERVIFINTGFLDRTGDEIHTSMEAGPFLPKAEIKQQVWISAYENWNVDVGLDCGLKGKAQIGKGMWAMPDLMQRMLDEKIGHPQAGATTAWVPSPTAAILHALHYHQVDVAAVQAQLAKRETAKLDDILTIPLMEDPAQLSNQDIERELQNNIQGILGYVVRWINQGVGCSKVPDIHNVGLMEDRATLRISSQLLANWLHHGICTEDQIIDVMQKMAVLVDKQNVDDPDYQNMCPDTDNSLAFQAAKDLILLGRKQPNGYTEPLLHMYRRKAKAISL